MRLIISESDSVKFRLPVPSSAVIFMLRSCKPLLKAYRGYPIVEVREKDGTELVITL